MESVISLIRGINTAVGYYGAQIASLPTRVDRRDRMTIPPKQKYHPETKVRPGASSPADYPWNNGSILIW
jgi:hypothetical protein